MGFLNKLIGGKQKTIDPKSMYSLQPKFYQDAMRGLIDRGVGLSNNASLFAPVNLGEEGEMALANLRNPVERLNANNFGSMMSLFQNPFENQVVQNAIGDLTRGAEFTQNNINQGATGAGAFGVTRQAMLEAENQRNLLDAIGRTSGSLRSQNFNNAVQNSLQQFQNERQAQNQRTQNLFNADQMLRNIRQGQIQAPLRGTEYLGNILARFPVGAMAPQIKTDTGIFGAPGMKNLMQAVAGGAQMAMGKPPGMPM